MIFNKKKILLVRVEEENNNICKWVCLKTTPSIVNVNSRTEKPDV